MTCIVAIADGETVYMGADSGCTIGFNLSQLEEAKLFVRGELLIGDAGSVRGGQIVRYRFEPPPIDPKDSLTGYFASRFADALRGAMSGHGAQRDDGCELLIGARGRIFHISEDGAVTSDPRQRYHAIGGAAPYALGALFASGHLPLRERLVLALAAAQHHAVNVLKPFTYMSLPAGQPG